MDGLLEEIYKQSSSIGFIGGKRDSGKTDLALRILEDGKAEGFWSQIGTNTNTLNDPHIDYICYMDSLEDWLNLPGKKAFCLDELGVHLNKMRSMSTMSKMILDICQLIRKHDAHLIGVAPSSDFINKLFLNSDILDYRMKKLSRKRVYIYSLVAEKWAILEAVPRTTLAFKTKDSAIFELKNPNKKDGGFDSRLPQEQALLLYAKYHTMRAVAKVMKISAMQVSRLIKKELEEQKLQ